MGVGATESGRGGEVSINDRVLAIRRQELRSGLPDDFGRSPAEHRLGGCVEGTDRAVDTEGENPFGRVLDHRAVVRLAALRVVARSCGLPRLFGELTLSPLLVLEDGSDHMDRDREHERAEAADRLRLRPAQERRRPSLEDENLTERTTGHGNNRDESPHGKSIAALRSPRPVKTLDQRENLVVARAFKLHELMQENRRLRMRQADSPMQGILSRDPGMLKLCRSIEKVAPSDASVVLLGESGTGKEVLARALHSLSPRASKKFVAINCAAIPENLLESELFGYEKGAFTGAAKQTRGKIEYADGGTFFLDEVGDLSSALQAKLLRFLQERIIERIGGREEIAVDVRIVCATHQNLQGLIKVGRFREDLYYRLSEIVITIPPLRDRQGDRALLAHAFVNKFASQGANTVAGLSDEALNTIDSYDWPGNVREMENCIKRAVIMAEGTHITSEDLGINAMSAEPEPLNLRQVRDDAERKAVVKALARSDGNIVKAAESLGVSRPTLYDLMTRHNVR